MNKPLSISIKETKDSLIQICNESHLPPCILELIVQTIYTDISILSKKYLDEDELIYMANSMIDDKEKEIEKLDNK